MGILEKLRPQPRWRHADPAVRAAAVYELGPDDSDALHALAREDVEPRVRRAAVTRIDDAGALAEVAKNGPRRGRAAEAVRGLAGIAAEADDLARAIEAVRELLGLGRTKELMLVARDSSSADVRAAWSTCWTTRRRSARSAGMRRDSATRLTALERLTDARRDSERGAQGRAHRRRRRRARAHLGRECARARFRSVPATRSPRVVPARGCACRTRRRAAGCRRGAR